jgi:hypothetical protein
MSSAWTSVDIMSLGGDQRLASTRRHDPPAERMPPLVIPG